ncbi:MAG: hypothetical protein WC858_04705 [Parcubacteria group bacterium]|jgi:hypothetical protein
MGGEYAQAYTIENYQENVEDRFVISPVNLELTLAPGETTTQNIVIVNRLGKTADFQITKEDFVGSQDPDKATSFLGDESAGITTAKDWISTDVDQIPLNHGDRLNIPVTITAPDNATAGSHYAAIFASVAGSESGTGNARVKLVSRVGTLILINIPGNNRESGGITDFSSDKKYYRQGPVDFSTTFENTGNVYEKVRGEIAIKNILGTEIAHVPLKDWTVLSNSLRKQTASWDKKWIMGRYTATLTVFYGLGGNLKDTKTVVFYAFPWHVALLLLLALIIIYYLLKYFFSKFEIRKKE